jgi:CBS domain containing-hemolysin-like protein
MDFTLALALLVATLMSALFSGSETGFYAFSRLRLRVELERGQAAARSLQRLIEKPSLMLATLLIGNNLALELVTICGQVLLDRHSGLTPQVRATVGAAVLTPIMFVFCEAVPKNVYLNRPYERLIRGLWLLRPFHRLMLPLSVLVATLAEWLGRRVAVPQIQESAAGSEGIEPALRIGEREGVLSRTQHLLAAGVLRFGELRAADVSIPTNYFPRLALPADAATWREAFAAGEHTRALVFDDKTHEVRGMVHALDLAVASHDDQPLESVVRPLPVVRGSLPVHELLQILHREGQALALVKVGRSQKVKAVRLQDVAERLLGR